MNSKMTETIQTLKEDIAILQEKLQKLEELQRTKSPAEIAFKDWWGEYPRTEIWTEYDKIRWVSFSAGYYNASKVSETPQEPEDNDKNFKNSLDLIKEWGEKNKPPTLKELLWEWWEDIFTRNSDLDADASIDVLVDIIGEKFIPPSSDRNGYEWEKCLKMMREKLR